VLRAFERAPQVRSDFVRRNRYRAGNLDREGAYNTFRENLLANEYTLCVRGTGNFSARLYEALSAGRVPVLVDTGAVLPLEGAVDWSAHLVLLDRSCPDRWPEQVVGFHTARGREAIGACNRDLWREWLEENSFFGRLVDLLRAWITGRST
jgi:hypothetical protein